jgi:hypothetical protein
MYGCCRSCCCWRCHSRAKCTVSIPIADATYVCVPLMLLPLVLYVQEAYHLQTFNDFLDKRGLRGVATAPYVYRQFSSKRCATLNLQS